MTNHSLQNIMIIPMNADTTSHINSFDSEFRVYGYLDLQINEGTISYKLIKSEPWQKKYEEQEIDVSKYVGSEKRIVFFAYREGEVVGQIILKENWNKYGFIEDIRIKTQYKGCGIGKALMDKAKEWVAEKGLGGLTLETQNINVDACLFYEKCGFIIGGMDHCFYKQFPTVQNEVALYWYWLNDAI